ncbi:MAG: beta-lactamase family protein [Tabrizicola sp.]|nr:beta-lactamase family protein [Tabrizicola sp.]
MLGKIFGAVLITGGLMGGAAPAITVDEAVTALLAETEAPGVAMGVFRKGAVASGFGGLRILGQEAEIGDSDLWHIGSNTKAMTATLVARLVEAGAVSWDDTVGEVLGASIPGIDAAYRDASYIDLLSHRAGLAPNIGRFASMRLSGALASRDIRADRLAYAADILADPPAGAVGDFLYSNAGYVVAGAMLEASTGESWETLLRTEIAEPLGMTALGFGAPGTPGAADQPRGHAPALFGGLKPVEPGPGSDNVPALGPAGTAHLSVADMMRFLRAHVDEDPAFLSADSWALLHRPVAGGDYALGWGIDGECLVHNGSNTLWFARMAICPGSGTAALIFTNDGDSDALRDPVARIMDGLLAD